MHPNHKKFILGDTQGNITTFEKYYYKNLSHSDEISGIIIDKHNKLIISSSLDSSILVQRETMKKCERIKLVKNAHFGEYISAICFSAHLNLIASSAGGVIFFWNYEHMRIWGAWSNEFSEVIFMRFLEANPVLVSFDRSNEVILWQISKATYAIYTPMVKIVFDGMNKNILMSMWWLTTSDLSNLSISEESLPYVRWLTKSFEGVPFTEDELTNQRDYRKIQEDEKEESYDDIYITSTKIEERSKQVGYDKQFTIVFSDEEGNAHIIDLSKYLFEFGISEWQNETLRHNYFPYRPVNMTENGMYADKEELYNELNRHWSDSYETELLSEISRIYHHKWRAFDDHLTMLEIVETPK
jgi:hypothetical protein